MSTENTDQSTLTSSEMLVFYGITSAGTLQPRELFRFMENTGPQWWLPVSGMTRHEFWTSRRRTLVARRTTIRLHANDCHINDKVVVRHVITHGRRPRSADRVPEYGFVDFLEVRRESDGVVLSDLTADSVWIDFSDGTPRVATTPPEGLNCPDEELPFVESPPLLPDPAATFPFRWTQRETDANGHIAFPCYYERAENAMADAGYPLAERGTWQGWYRQESAAADAMQVAVQPTDEGVVFGFAGEGERRPRVTVRYSPTATN